MFTKYIARVLFFVCAFIICAHFPATAEEGKAEVKYLKNGLGVLIIPDTRFPLASLRLYVHAGSGFETPKIAGLSHALEHMVFKGTKNYPHSGVSETIESLGGYFNAYTTFDHTCYLTDIPAKGWEEGLKVLKDMAFFPTIDPADLKSEMEVVVEEIQRGRDDPGNELFRMVQTQMFKGTTYAWPIIGTEDTVRSFKSADLRKYIAAHYKPGNMLLVICGNVDSAAAFDAAQKLFGDLKPGKTQSAVPPVNLDNLRQKPVILVAPKDLNQIYLSFAFPVPGTGAPDEAGLEVLARLLGGDATSYLYRKYKYDLRFVDEISASVTTMQGAGILFFSAVLKPEKLPEFWSAICADLAGLSAANFTEEDIARAKLNIEDGLFREKETLAGLASKEGYFYFLDGGPEGEERFLQGVRATSAADLQKLINKYVQKDTLTAALLTPKDYTPPDLEAVLQEKWQAPAPEKTVSDASEIAPGKPEVLTLGPGRTVILLKDDTLPYTSLNLAISGGNSLLAQNEQGLAALSSSALTMATKSKNNEELERFWSDRAASMDATAGRHMTNISASFPTRFSDDILPSIAEVLSAPAFDPTDLDRAKDSQLAAIKASADQPMGLMFRELYPFLFKGHSYGYYNLGTPEGVSAFTVADALRFWTKQSARPWTLAVCGQFDRDKILKFAASLPLPEATGAAPAATPGAPLALNATAPTHNATAPALNATAPALNAPTLNATGLADRNATALPGGLSDAASLLPPPPAWGEAQELDLKLPGRNQTHILLLFKTVPDSSEDAPGLELLQQVLNGMGGPLFLELREKQALAYTVEAMAWQSPLTGFMAFYIGTSPDKEKQALDGFYKIISGVQATPFTEADLARGINRMEGDYYRGIQSLGSRATEAAILNMLGRPLTFATDNIAKAKSLTPQDLQKLAEKYLVPGQAYLIRVDPAETAAKTQTNLSATNSTEVKTEAQSNLNATNSTEVNTETQTNLNATNATEVKTEAQTNATKAQ